MTDNGRRVLKVMLDLEKKDAATENEWSEASRIAKHYSEQFGEITTMQASSFLTHMRRERLVERHAGADKKFAWWRLTTKGRELADA